MSKINSFLYIFTTILISFYNYSKVEGKNFEKGEAIFRSNCIICHLGGNNIIIPENNLKKEALETIGGWPEEFFGWGAEDDAMSIKVRHFLKWKEMDFDHNGCIDFAEFV